MGYPVAGGSVKAPTWKAVAKQRQHFFVKRDVHSVCENVGFIFEGTEDAAFVASDFTPHIEA